MYKFKSGYFLLIIIKVFLSNCIEFNAPKFYEKMKTSFQLSVYEDSISLELLSFTKVESNFPR